MRGMRNLTMESFIALVKSRFNAFLLKSIALIQGFSTIGSRTDIGSMDVTFGPSKPQSLNCVLNYFEGRPLNIEHLGGYSQNFLRKFVKISLTLGLYILSFLRLKVLFKANISKV